MTNLQLMGSGQIFLKSVSDPYQHRHWRKSSVTKSFLTKFASQNKDKLSNETPEILLGQRFSNRAFPLFHNDDKYLPVVIRHYEEGNNKLAKTCLTKIVGTLSICTKYTDFMYPPLLANAQAIKWPVFRIRYSEARIRIFPFSRKGVEPTEIMLKNKNFIPTFLAKNLISNIKHSFEILKLINFN